MNEKVFAEVSGCRLIKELLVLEKTLPNLKHMHKESPIP
jgi:hypothetical protein